MGRAALGEAGAGGRWPAALSAGEAKTPGVCARCVPGKRTGTVSAAVICDTVILTLWMKKQKVIAVTLRSPGKREKRENRSFDWQR